MRQNGITQQILAQYLQKRLNRGSVQQVGQQQPFAPTAAGTESSVVLQRNTADNVFVELEDNGGVVEDTQYYQGSGTITRPHTLFKGHRSCIYIYIYNKSLKNCVKLRKRHKISRMGNEMSDSIVYRFTGGDNNR